MIPWRAAARKAEDKLHEFLGLDDTVAVIYLNRAANGIKIALERLYVSNDCLIYQYPSYEAVWNIASRLGYTLMPCFNFKKLLHLGYAYSPAALGGEAIRPEFFQKFYRILYDCAQTCYPCMFEGVFFGPEQYAVLSFEQSKPLGTLAGGGALLCHKKHEEIIREKYTPGKRFFNPRTGQCYQTEGAVTFYHHNPLPAYRAYNKIADEVKLRGFKVVHDHFNCDLHNTFTHIYVLDDYKGSPGEDWEPYCNGALWRKPLCY